MWIVVKIWIFHIPISKIIVNQIFPSQIDCVKHYYTDFFYPTNSEKELSMF